MRRRDLLRNLGVLAGGLSISDLTHSAPVAPKRALRIAHVTDIHIQPHLWAAHGLKKCLHHLQDLDIKPDFILNSGDSVMGAHGISRSKAGKEWELYQKVIESENEVPLFSCVGNHDIWCRKEASFTFEDGKKWAMDEVKLSRPYYSFDRNGWHFIVLDSVQPQADGFSYTAFLDEEQMDWLKKDLKHTAGQTPIMITSHIPILSACVFLDGDNVKNGSWIVPGSWMHTDAAELMSLFNKHPNIKLAVSGHIHLQDRVSYNGITYCCNGAVSGNYWMGKYKQTHAGYAIIDLFDDGSFENRYVSYHTDDH